MVVDFDMIDNTEKKTYFHQYSKKWNRSSLCNVAVQFTVHQSPCCTDPAWAEAVSPCVTQHGQFVTRSCALYPSRIKLRKSVIQCPIWVGVGGTAPLKMQMPLCHQMVHLAAKQSPTTVIDGGNKVHHYFIFSVIRSLSLNKVLLFSHIAVNTMSMEVLPFADCYVTRPGVWEIVVRW